MAYPFSDEASAESPSFRHSLSGSFAAFRAACSDYRARKARYHQTLGELRSYRRDELLEIGIDPDSLDNLARRHAGL